MWLRQSGQRAMWWEHSLIKNSFEDGKTTRVTDGCHGHFILGDIVKGHDLLHIPLEPTLFCRNYTEALLEGGESIV